MENPPFLLGFDDTLRTKNTVGCLILDGIIVLNVFFRCGDYEGYEYESKFLHPWVWMVNTKHDQHLWTTPTFDLSIVFTFVSLILKSKSFRSNIKYVKHSDEPFIKSREAFAGGGCKNSIEKRMLTHIVQGDKASHQLHGVRELALQMISVVSAVVSRNIPGFQVKKYPVAALPKVEAACDLGA